MIQFSEYDIHYSDAVPGINVAYTASLVLLFPPMINSKLWPIMYSQFIAFAHI